MQAFTHAEAVRPMAIQQEFAWDETAGMFQTVNIYTIGEVEDYIADMCEVLVQGPAGTGELIGWARDYAIWDQENQQWALTYYCGDPARGVIQRYAGDYITAEGECYRRDNVYYEKSPDGLYDHLIDFEPELNIALANGWLLRINQDYTQWGHAIRLTSPKGEVSYVYGDPHLLQAGGTHLQELAAVGNYVFDLTGGYTLHLSCMKENAGFSLVTNASIRGPNDFWLTMGRNSGVRVSGGTHPAPSSQLFVYHYVPVEGAAFESDSVTIAVESALTEVKLYLNGTAYPLSGTAPFWNITLNGLENGEYRYYLWGTDGSKEYTSSTRSFSIGQQTAPVPTMNEWGMLLFMLLIGLGAVYCLRKRGLNSA
jgi:hypothetical protein